MSCDEYVVAAALCPEHKETFITAAGVREEVGGGCLLCCGFLFLTPITSYLGGKHQASILFNTFEDSDLFFFLSLLCLPHVSVITASFSPSSHSLVFPDNIITQTEYVAAAEFCRPPQLWQQKVTSSGVLL